MGMNLLGYASVVGEFNDLADQIDDDTTWIVGSNVEYSIYQELGTRHMPPQPYLRPATRKATKQAEEIVKNTDSTEELVKQIALQIERDAAKRAPVGETGNLQASIKAVEE